MSWKTGSEFTSSGKGNIGWMTASPGHGEMQIWTMKGRTSVKKAIVRHKGFLKVHVVWSLTNPWTPEFCVKKVWMQNVVQEHISSDETKGFPNGWTEINLFSKTNYYPGPKKPSWICINADSGDIEEPAAWFCADAAMLKLQQLQITFTHSLGAESNSRLVPRYHKLLTQDGSFFVQSSNWTVRWERRS